jgi:hypothetical protein
VLRVPDVSDCCRGREPICLEITGPPEANAPVIADSFGS